MNGSNLIFRLFFCLLISLTSLSGVYAQGQGFDLSGSIITKLVKNQVNLENAKPEIASLTIYSDSVKFRVLMTNKKDGSFTTHLPYGHNYKIAFTNPSFVPMYLYINAQVPKEIYSTLQELELSDIPFYDRKSVGFDTVKYRFAFDKYQYDPGKKKLMRDADYFVQFTNGKTREYLDYRAALRDQKDANSQTDSAKSGKADKLKAGKSTSAPAIRVNYLIGKILAGNPPLVALKNIKVTLTGDRGEPLTSCLTNNSGRFVFEHVLMDQNYTINIAAEDLKSLAGQKISLLSKKDKEVTSALAGSAFSFHLLSSDKKSLELLASEDCSFLISGSLLTLINNVTHPIANTRIHLKDEKGNVVEAIFTNDFGTFVFTKTPSCQNFQIELAENNPKLAGVKVIITDHNGKEISSTTCTGDGQFNFEFLKQDELKLQTMEVEETTLRLDMKGKLFKNTAGNALSNAKVDLMKNDTIVQTVSTDNAGSFKFSKVPYFNQYSIAAASEGVQRIILADANGVVIKEFKSGVIVNTIRLPLLPAEQQKMASITIADPWAEVITGSKEIIIPEKVYFEVNDFKITKEGRVILDKVIRIMKTEPKIRIEVSSHTDAQGSAAYNLDLSKKRAGSAQDYMIAQGIDKNRITGIGYGATRLINKCSEGVACTEEEHAQNRRLEFKITYSK